MTVELDYVLESCLDRLAQGETLQACLSRYPEYAVDLEPLLVAAGRLKKVAQVRPSPAFKTRARQQLRAHMDAHPHKQRTFLPILPLTLRMAFTVAALMLVLVATTGMAVAQFALPGDLLYPWKLGSESAWRAISPDPVGTNLRIGQRRIDEALAVQGNSTAQEVALHGYQIVIGDLTQYKDDAAQERITETLKVQQEKLNDAGLQLPKPQDLPVSLP